MTNHRADSASVSMEGLEARRLMAAINVADFGAKPNDGVDDTGAIRAAINASKNGDSINFGAGTYNVSSTIELKSNRSYLGNNSTISRPPGQAFIFGTDAASSNFTVNGLTLDGAGIEFHGGQARNVRITNNTFQNLTGRWTVGNALLVPKGMKDSLIQGNTFKNIMGETGIFGFGAWDNTLITENHFEDVMEGIHMWYQGDGLKIVDNTFYHIKRMGIELQGVNAKNTLVESNYLTEWRDDRYHESFALSIVNFGDNTIIRNNFMSSGKPGEVDPRASEAPVGIEVAGRNVLVEGNVVQGFREGMHLMYTPDGIVRKNTLSDQTWMAVWRTGVHEAHRVTVEDNVILNPKQYAFLWQGSADTAAGTVIQNNRIELKGNATEFSGNKGNVTLKNIINQGIPDIPTTVPQVPSAPSAPAQKPVIGTGNGLRAEYYDKLNFKGLSIVRTDSNINHDWGLGSPDARIHPESFSARWTGQVLAPTTEEYTFYASSDDGVRIWVDGKLIINGWYDHAQTLFSSKVKLVAGKMYDIKVEYYEHGGNALAKLAWSSPTQQIQIIPKSQLYSSKSSGVAAASSKTPAVSTAAADTQKTKAKAAAFSNTLIGYNMNLLGR